MRLNESCNEIIQLENIYCTSVDKIQKLVNCEIKYRHDYQIKLNIAQFCVGLINIGNDVSMNFVLHEISSILQSIVWLEYSMVCVTSQ